MILLRTTSATTPTRKTKMSSSRAEEMVELPGSFSLSDADVWCAKGKEAKVHPGNKYLASVIEEHLEEYNTAVTKLEKSFVVSKIIKAIRKEGGLFVRHVRGKWYEIGSRNEREKIGQVSQCASTSTLPDDDVVFVQILMNKCLLT